MDRSRVRLIGMTYLGGLLLAGGALVSATGCASVLATGMYVLQGGNMVPAACDALEDQRVVVMCRPPASNEYRHAGASRNLSQRVSEKLTDKIGVSTAVGVLDQYDVVYVAYASARRFPHLLNRSVGTHLPAITSAVGRVMIAGLPPQVARGWLAKAKIERYTSLTRTDRAEIETILEDIRSRGFSIVDQELEAAK